MNKRIIVLVLLLLSVFFYSCSSRKNASKVKSKDVVIPIHSNHMHEELGEKNEKAKTDDDLKKKHYESQTESVKKEMKKNKKISMKNTPVRKKKNSCFSWFKKDRVCGDGSNNVMTDDGVRDVR